MIVEHDHVALTKSLPDLGLKPGDVGVVVHVNPNGKSCEVEFMTEQGISVSVVTRELADVRSISFECRTEEEFFEHGRHIARLADAGKPIPKQTASLEGVGAILLDVVKVDVRSDFKLHLEFENGEKRIFDMPPYMNKKPFSQLHGNFAQAHVSNGTVCCPGNIDIAPETLYYRSVPESV
jgi:hypothetical protein